MEEYSVSTIDGKGEMNKIQKEEEKTVEKTMDENVCEPVVGNQKGDEEQVIDEVNDGEMDTVNEIEVDGSTSVPISGETKSYPKEVNDGVAVVNNMEEMTTLEGTVKTFTVTSSNSEPLKSTMGESSVITIDGKGEMNKIQKEEEKTVEKTMDENVCEPVVGSLKGDEEQVIDEVNDGEMDIANEIEVDGSTGVPISGETKSYPKEVNDGGAVVNNMKEMTTLEGTVKAVIITSSNSEPLKSTMEVSTIDGKGEMNKIQSEEEKTVEKTMDENVCEPVVGSQKGDEEQVINEVNDREIDTANEIEFDGSTGAPISGETKGYPKEVNDGGDVVNNMEEMTTLEGTVKGVEIVIYRPDTKDVNTEESLQVATSSMVGGGSAAPEHQLNVKKKLLDNPHPQHEKETNKLNIKAPVGTVLDSKKRKFKREDANSNVKAASDNVQMTKRRRLNRKMFEEKGLGNNGASMTEIKPCSLIGNDACNEPNELDANERVKKPLVAVCRKLRVRKKDVSKGHAGMRAANDAGKSKPTNDEPEIIENKIADKQDLRNEEAVKSGDGVCHLRGDKEEKVEKDHTIQVASKRVKSSNRVDLMGMIFMCSSETKKDCYRYKVVGLPAGKKDIVSMIYNGMRIFLYDFDLKIMYGIYKAVGPGGYNIEPRAFRSQFPSQVRFTVLEDCVPLTENKFRSVIKDNYYTKYKFNFQLTSQQVKNLCNLFHETTNRANYKSRRGRIAGAPSSLQQGKKRRTVDDDIRTGLVSPYEWERNHTLSEEGVRCDPGLVSDRYHHHPTYEGETYLQSAAQSPLYQPFPAQNTSHSASYTYGPAPIMDIDMSDLAMEHREPSLYECKYDQPVEWGCHDPYASYIESQSSYHEPAYETIVRDTYREPVYETQVCQEGYTYPFDPHQVEHRYAEYHLPLSPCHRY